MLEYGAVPRADILFDAGEHRITAAALKAHYKQVKGQHLRTLFAEDATRRERMAVEAAGIYLDYSKNRTTNETLKLRLRPPAESSLRVRSDAMFRGEKD